MDSCWRSGSRATIRAINEEICRILPEDKADDYRLMVAVLSRSVGGYLRSTLINSVIQGFLAFVGFTIVGHPYAITMGILSGILNIIPVVGPSISAIIATLIALVYSPIMAIWTMVMAMISQNITDNVIAPKINQSTMQVHPVLSLTALVVGSTFGGAIGMIVALPLVAVIKSLFIFYFETRTWRADRLV
ncbi:MAG: AI-2E family transporter [Collinsella sp.]